MSTALLDISVTDKARGKLAELEVGAQRFLRIRVVAGGCSGNTYDAAIDSDLADDDDVVFEDGDLRIVADRRSSLFVDGLTIDYSDDLIQAGFRLVNKNASQSCGCGASFSI
jgi:iron-sulfur cluster assembly accessory protein